MFKKILLLIPFSISATENNQNIFTKEYLELQQINRGINRYKTIIETFRLTSSIIGVLIVSINDEYKFQPSWKKKHISSIFFATSEILDLCITLYSPYSIIGSLLKLTLNITGTALDYLFSKRINPILVLIVINIINVLFTYKINKIHKKSDLYILQNIKLNESFNKNVIEKNIQ